MGKHTLGPWKVKLGTYLVQDLADTRIPEGTIVGIYGAERRDVLKGHYPYPANDEDKANARLIAAAPELLEALKVVLEDIRQGGHASEVEGIGAKCPLSCPLCIIESAIAKAEGRHD